MMMDFNALRTAPGQRLRSLKNEVVRLTTDEGSVIRKTYHSDEAYQQERTLLSQLIAAGLPVPRVLHQAPQVLFLEDVGKQTYVEWLEACEAGDDAYAQREAYMQALLAFLCEFRRSTGCGRGDVNLRNFLFRDGLCCGVDFEEPLFTTALEYDVGRVIAFVLTYAPAFSDRRVGIAQALWQAALRHGCSAPLLKQAMREEFLAMLQRRPNFAPLYAQAMAFRPEGWEGYA